MSDDKAQVPPGTETVEEVGRIRDILFGQQMRDYQQRFDALRRDLDRQQGELDRLREQLAEQDADQGKKLGAQRQETRAAEEALRSELRETAALLSDQKADRTVLAEFFLQLGAILKNGGQTDGLLKSLGGPAKD
jgi:septal ring factor EnvC (AmiA/AmiB activator)